METKIYNYTKEEIKRIEIEKSVMGNLFVTVTYKDGKEQKFLPRG